MPLVEFSNFTVDQPAPLYRIFDSQGKPLTECTLGYPNSYGLPGLETHMGRPYSEVKARLSSVVSEVEIDEAGDAAFYFEPNEPGLHMEIVARTPLKRGEQMPYHYGNCSSRFFLVNYGFCLPNNQADAITLRIHLRGEEKIVLLHRGGSQAKYLSLISEQLKDLGLD